MFRYVVRRVLWGVVMLLIVSMLTFVVFYLLPSADPAQLRAGKGATPARVAEIRHSLGLDRPVYEQFWIYMKRLVLHFDLGYSFHNEVSVKQEIFSRLPVTFSVALGAFVIWILAGIPISIQITKAPTATENVTGRRLKISDLTETLLWNE